MTTQALHRLTISVIEGKELSQKDRNGTSDPFVSVRILTVIPNSNAGAEVQTPSTGTNANVVDNTNNNNAGTEANGANPQKRKSNKVKLFKKSDSGKSSVRENIVLRGIRTHVIKKTLNPQWDEVFEIDIDLADNFMLVFTCWDKDLLINDFMGEVRIPARRLLSNPGQGIDEWFDLQSRQGRRDKVNGSLHLAISYVETTTQPETNNINVPANGAKPTSPRRNWALSPKMSRRFKSPIFSRDSERFRELIRQFSKLVADCLESGKLDPLEKQLNQYKKDNLDLKTFFSCDMWDNKSPLSEALRKNNKDAVKLLLKFNADPNRSLCDSAQAAEIDLARQLIDEYGANANCEFEGEETSMTPLAYCLTNSGLTTDQKVSITKLLLEKGADPLKRVAFHANAYQYVRKEVENEKDYTALISALKINGSDSFILPRYSFVGLDRPMPRSEPLLVTAGQKINLREFLPKNIEISPAEEDFKSVVVNAEYKENEIGIVELAFRLSDKSAPTVVRVLFHVFNKNRVAYFTDVWYEVDQGAEDQCENITVALGMNPYIYYSKKTTHVDDCQYTLAYVYWTRPTDDESAATEEKQKSDIEKAKNNKEEEKYQYTSFRYISAVGMSSIPPRPMKGRRYFSSELPRDEESQDLPRPLRYGAGQSVSKLEEDDKNNKSNTNTNSIVNSNTTSDVHTNTVVSPNNGRRSLSMSTPTKPGTPIAEITIPREGLSPRNEASELGGSVVFNDLFTCVATGTATQLKTMLDTKTYPIEELNQCLTKACLIFAPKKAALLLKVGAEPAYYDAADGVYPIHRAVQYASFANDVIIHKMGLNVRLFVSKGVDLSVKDKKGNGVMDYVPFKHKAKIESALKEKRGFDELYKSVLAEIEKDDKK